MDRLFQKPLQISRSKKSTQNETSSIQLSKESVGNTTVSICKYMENKDIQVYLDRRIEMLAEKIVSIVDKVEKDQLIKTLQEDSLTKEFTAQRIYEIIVKTLASDQERHLEELALQISLYKSTNEQLIQSLGDTQKDNQSKEQFLEELSNQVQVFKQQNAKQNQENVFNQMAQQCNIIQQLQQQLSDAKQRQINFDISAELEHFKQQITKNQQDLENYENEAQKKNEIIKNLKSEAKNLEKDQQILKSNFEQLLYENEQLKAQILSIESNNEHKIDHIKKKYENLSKQQLSQLSTYQATTEEIAKCLQELTKMKKIQDDEIDQLKQQNRELQENLYQVKCAASEMKKSSEFRKKGSEQKIEDSAVKYDHIKKTNKFLTDQIQHLNNFILNELEVHSANGDTGLNKQNIKEKFHQIVEQIQNYRQDIQSFHKFSDKVKKEMKSVIHKANKTFLKEINNLQKTMIVQIEEKELQIKKLRQTLAESEKNEVSLLRMNKLYQQQIVGIEKGKCSTLSTDRPFISSRLETENRSSASNINRSYERSMNFKKTYVSPNQKQLIR